MPHAIEPGYRQIMNKPMLIKYYQGRHRRFKKVSKYIGFMLKASVEQDWFLTQRAAAILLCAIEETPDDYACYRIISDQCHFCKDHAREGFFSLMLPNILRMSTWINEALIRLSANFKDLSN